MRKDEDCRCVSNETMIKSTNKWNNSPLSQVRHLADGDKFTQCTHTASVCVSVGGATDVCMLVYLLLGEGK